MWTEGQTDGQKDMTKLIVVFRNFANAPKKDKFSVKKTLFAEGKKFTFFRTLPVKFKVLKFRK
jgi:hypothetical protein